MGNVATGDSSTNEWEPEVVNREHTIILHCALSVSEIRDGGHPRLKMDDTISMTCTTMDVRYNLLSLIKARLFQESKTLDVTYILHDVLVKYVEGLPVYSSVSCVEPTPARVKQYKLTERDTIEFTLLPISA